MRRRRSFFYSDSTEEFEVCRTLKFSTVVEASCQYICHFLHTEISQYRGQVGKMEQTRLAMKAIRMELKMLVRVFGEI